LHLAKQRPFQRETAVKVKSKGKGKKKIFSAKHPIWDISEGFEVLNCWTSYHGFELIGFIKFYIFFIYWTTPKKEPKRKPR
jgi:hypothetical protein